MQSLKKNWLLVPKMTWGIWWILMRAVASLKICTLLGYFCRKYVMFELKRYREVVSWKMTYGFKNDISNLVSLHTSSWKKCWINSSEYNVLAEGMHFLGKSPSNFNFLDFTLLVWSCSNFSCDFWNQKSAFV